MFFRNFKWSIFSFVYPRAKKVVVQGTNMAHLLELQALAMSLSLPTYLVQDAGLTQVSEALHLLGGGQKESAWKMYWNLAPEGLAVF